MTKYAKISLLLLRIAIGLLFLYAGLDKLINGFSATGFLLNATAGPFKELYAGLANNDIVDFLVVFGEIAIGTSILTGTLVRFASFMGILMMSLFYLAALPPEHGPISEHIIYALVFLVMAAQGAGRFVGIDGYLERLALIKRNKYLRYFLG